MIPAGEPNGRPRIDNLRRISGGGSRLPGGD